LANHILKLTKAGEEALSHFFVALVAAGQLSA
ncbi:unnamed protein product, partial [marine sediment metagenome]